MVMQEKSQTVLITGGSGLIGRYLTSRLLEEGFNVAHLSRSQDQFGKVRVYRWDPAEKIINEEFLSGIDYVIHLAGTNIGNGRWNANRKKEILSSRVGSANFLHEVLSSQNLKLKAFISASAIGYYGAVTTEKIFTEDDPPAVDFLGNVCKSWEEAADRFSDLSGRVVKIRTGVVLERSDSAVSKLLRPAQFGVFPVTGDGRQFMPWIHIHDLTGIYLKSVNDISINGTYNAVAPQFSTHREFMSELARALDKRFFGPPVPGFILKIAMGEMADVVLKGSRVSAGKIIKAGYHFKFDNLPSALNDILKM